MSHGQIQTGMIHSLRSNDGDWQMDEALAREIHTATDLSKYPRSQLAEADRWMKDYALNELRKYMRRFSMPPAISKYTLDMARYTYGSVETDQMLTKCKCYPEWVNTRNQ